MTNNQKLKSITKFCDELGIDHDYKIAQTRTIYLTIGHNRISGELVIRIADHGDVYATADFSIDDVYATAAECKKWILGKIDFSNQSLNRLRKNNRRKNKIEKENKENELINMADIDAKLHLCKNKKQEFFTCKFIKEDLFFKSVIVRKPTKKDILLANKNWLAAGFSKKPLI